jgi:hypothetical protein
MAQIRQQIPPYMKGFLQIKKKKYNFVFDTENNLVHMFKKLSDTKPVKTKNLVGGQFVGQISGQELVPE